MKGGPCCGPILSRAVPATSGSLVRLGEPPPPGQDWAPHQEGRPSHTWMWLRTWALAQIFRECKSSKSLHLQEPLLLSSGSEENSFHLEWLLGD